MFYHFIIKYTDIFCLQIERSFCNATNGVVNFEQPGTGVVGSLNFVEFLYLALLCGNVKTGETPLSAGFLCNKCKKSRHHSLQDYCFPMARKTGGSYED